MHQSVAIKATANLRPVWNNSNVIRYCIVSSFGVVWNNWKINTKWIEVLFFKRITLLSHVSVVNSQNMFENWTHSKALPFLITRCICPCTWALVMVTCRHVQSSNSFHTYEFKAPLKWYTCTVAKVRELWLELTISWCQFRLSAKIFKVV